ncbi:pyridoxal phosphate-dependent aminotransferase [bacterium]|nr:pyridoxal phosphate-dependent aminotransferase [bacterium]
MPTPAEIAKLSFKPSIFNRIKEEMDRRSGSGDAPIALHVGDTWYDLPPEINEPLDQEPWNSRLSRYGDTQGEPELRKRLAKKVREQNGLAVESERQIQVTFGATGGLFLALRRLLDPGSEVLVLAPYWTIFKMVAATAGVRVVEVPFFDKVAEDLTTDLEALLAPHLTDKTAAIYFNNPNNPGGVLLDRGQLEQLGRFASKHDLWVLSDEAYEDFVWSDQLCVSIGSLEGMAERTISVFSFSKSYAMAGLRLGFVAATEGAIAAMNPGHVGVGYEPPRAVQVQAIRALERRDRIVPRLYRAYLEGRDAALRHIELPTLRADGSFFLFIDLRDRWAGLDDKAKLDRMLSAGVVLSPGAPFGQEYDGWARFCFTTEKPEVIAEAARRVNQL